MKTYCFYNADGMFLDKKIMLEEHMLEQNTREGETAIEGDFDHLSKRFDIESKSVIDYQPPQPSDDHEWNADTARWVIKAEIAQKRQDKARALSQLQSLDAKHLRALDEVVANPDNMVARDNLDSIRKLKEQLRSKLV